MKQAKKVTRIAYSDDLNQAKYEALTENAGRCGSVGGLEANLKIDSNFNKL